MNQKTIGASLLIAGTTIGAGMLAQPMISSGFGYVNSIVLLITMWVYMLIAAGITVEISHGRGQSIAALAANRLGKKAKYAATSSMLVLFWSLLWCYISGGSSVLQQEVGVSFPTSLLIFLFTLFFGLFVVLCTRAVDYANRFIFLAKIAVFLVILFCLFPFVKIDNLLPSHHPAPLSLVHVIPIFFTAYGFHGSIPCLITYLNGNKKNIYTSLILGSFIPLVVYILWQTVTLGIMGNVMHGLNDLGDFVNHLKVATAHPYLNFLTNCFAFLAIATSFLGVALGLFDFIKEWFHGDDPKLKLKVTLLTFGLPLVLALIYPNGFIMALGCAAVALSFLAIVLPCLIALKEPASNQAALNGPALNASWATSIFLNKTLVLCVLLGGLSIIAIEFVLKY